MTKSNFKDFLFSKRKDLILKGDYCTDLVDHDGERGRANEGHFSRFLKEFLPKKYKVGTGFIESVDDSRLRWSSPQTDIILYDDSNNSPLLYF